jgi:hypothetical protein
MLSPKQNLLLSPMGAHMWGCQLDIARNRCQDMGNRQPIAYLYLTRSTTYRACHRRGVQRQGEENAGTPEEEVAESWEAPRRRQDYSAYLRGLTIRIRKEKELAQTHSGNAPCSSCFQS